MKIRKATIEQILQSLIVSFRIEGIEIMPEDVRKVIDKLAKEGYIVL